MKLDLFDYNLPKEKIAQHPPKNRTDSKLMVLDKKTETITHKSFVDILEELTENDCLVLNETKVIPARLIGKKEETGAVIELLLLENKEDLWQALVKPAKRIKEGHVIVFGEGLLKAECIRKKEDGIAVFKMIYDGIFLEILDNLGQMPLPPYIYEKLEEKNRYQTVYAKNVGSAAAPTAGLHFTNDLLEKIKKKNIEIIKITLHVGLDTFRPISVEDVLEHKMHSEKYYISEEAARELNEAVKNKKRIVAVGTTTVRTLEANYDGKFTSGFNDTNLFIYPGYKYKIVNAILTNFHLPKLSLLLLVSAFANREFILKAYKEAINKGYRFFSFGDAMLIK